MKRIIAAALALFLIASVTQGQALMQTFGTSPLTYITSKFECGCERTGAGSMIGRNCLITAAHNLICSRHNKQISSCNFFLNWDGKTYAKKYSGRFTFRWYADFSHGYRSEDDIAYVVFQENIADKVGFFEYGIQPYGDDALGWDYCTMYGYDGKKRVSDVSKVEYADTKQICWPMSSGFRNCSEGGPVLWGSNFPFLIAVYTSHSGTTGYARLLTNDIISDMIRDGVDFAQD